MKSVTRHVFLLSAMFFLLTSSLLEAADDGHEVIFEDAFERAELGDRWLIPIPAFSLRNGRLLGQEVPDRGHGAVVRAPLSFRDAMIEFSFRFTDGKSFNLVINDKNCKSVHAGHVSRVSISPRQVRISDDREGAMKNEIFALLRDPEQKKRKRSEVLKGTELIVPHILTTDQWHRVSVSIVGEEMTVTIDDKGVGSLKSPGIAHPTKTDFGFTVTGKEIEFDDVRVRAISLRQHATRGEQ